MLPVFTARFIVTALECILGYPAAVPPVEKAVRFFEMNSSLYFYPGRSS